ncbi:bifunctional isocitrate dehydrogenase kinase/phosphatase [Alginatibacterium sediminis]|uniref:Isocitrate dehydrogenase kinase/phosphatase n=1 Tax=Alginatibacterium sediminis TaxID=2164068 RepID=A0A420ECW8_9ALTE|nr:bifunctional isocitrate dehydrogenase kinase/phosphatase [Alginatibacterium sediminis]RKF18513.1 bifunctional isocitrate dehydrogenase kinase/phosphatase [Alginatibacterium sediminis]
MSQVTQLNAEQIDLAQQAAGLIFERFIAFYDCFYTVTQRAKQRFESEDWSGGQEDANQRIRLYDQHVDSARSSIKTLTGHLSPSDEFSNAVKMSYAKLLKRHDNFEVAESFYNSVYQRLFRHRYIRAHRLFIEPSRYSAAFDYHPEVTKVKDQNLAGLLQQWLVKSDNQLPFASGDAPIKSITNYLESRYPQLHHIKSHQLEFTKEVFYRNRGAYLVGQYHGTGLSFPIMLPLVIREHQLHIDSVLCDSDELSIVFGFARAYFMFATRTPRRIVNFLKRLMPNKSDAELFTAIGCQKHGKTEFYRDYLIHMQSSEDNFELAAGIKGMVMCVFTLPSYPVVFKLIKDEFTPPKDIDEKTVKAKYQLVKRHDRVGRMADTQEFRNLEFPISRFDPQLISELQNLAPSKIKIVDETLTISHLYIERRMIPLNIYLEQANAEQLENAVEEYGSALKQLAAANIFPGDMLFKNFGVTRHGRVIFYDYDEISYMTEMNFRELPKVDSSDYFSTPTHISVGPKDVFPKEFATFLLNRADLRSLFQRFHPDLFTAKFWQDCQNDIRLGHYQEAYPYRHKAGFNQCD